MTAIGSHVSSFTTNIEIQGFAVVPDVLDRRTIDSLIQSLTNEDAGGDIRRRNHIYAIRNLLNRREVRTLATSDTLLRLVKPILGQNSRPVRGILFDKTPDANWKVVWHQDLSIAVKERLHVPGYGPWSVKAGVVHVQPPIHVLENMLTLRIHLDDCDETNGPLRVIPGSHKHGRMNNITIQEWRRTHSSLECHALAGGCVVMRPLLLHASSPSITPKHRRVIHIEYAGESLPYGLAWATD